MPEQIGNLINLESFFVDFNNLDSLPISICDIPDECNIYVNNNNLCEEYHYDCIDYWGQQDCIENFPGNECTTDFIENGFLDCELCCWDLEILSWLGDGYCDQFGGCAWEGPQFNCYELSYDCGDCDDTWDGIDISGLCYDCSSVYGDVNDDLIINVFDVILLVDCIILNNCNSCFDINSDNNINVLDVINVVGIILDT